MPTTNYRLVDTRSEQPGAALTVLQPAANLVGEIPDVNRDACELPTIAMNAGEFGWANRLDQHVL
jgi:hypothetical protein